MRPQVLSYLLIALTVGAWLRTWDDGRLRWWLVPVTWLWAMLHGMWPIGIGLGWSPSWASPSTAGRTGEVSSRRC